MDHAQAQLVSDFADQALLLPLALLVGTALWQRGRRQEARAWVVAVGGVLLALLVLKLGVGACATRVPGRVGLFGVGLRSPSGHSAAGGIVYGGLLAMWWRRGPWLSALLALAMASVIAVSRVRLGVHSPSDVAVGCAVAAAGGALLAWRSGWPAPRVAAAGDAGRIWPWSLAACVLVLSLHGHRLAAEPMIAQVARRWLSPACDW